MRKYRDERKKLEDELSFRCKMNTFAASCKEGGRASIGDAWSDGCGTMHCAKPRAREAVKHSE